MLKGPALALVLGASLAVGTGAQAREPGIVGVVTRVEPNTIEVLTDSGEKTSVTVNASTHISSGSWRNPGNRILALIGSR